MADHSSRPSDNGPAVHSQSLTDRVLARVADARVAADQGSKASRPRRQRRRPPSLSSSAADSRSPEEQREVESLKRVFRELGVSYRRYRSQTREPVMPALRDAAYNFRAEPSFTSLVAVAAFLDDLDLLS